MVKTPASDVAAAVMPGAFGFGCEPPALKTCQFEDRSILSILRSRLTKLELGPASSAESSRADGMNVNPDTEGIVVLRSNKKSPAERVENQRRSWR